MSKILVLGTGSVGLAAIRGIMLERANNLIVVGDQSHLIQRHGSEDMLNHQHYRMPILSKPQTFSEFKVSARRDKIIRDSKAKHAAKVARRLKRFK